MKHQRKSCNAFALYSELYSTVFDFLLVSHTFVHFCCFLPLKRLNHTRSHFLEFRNAYKAFIEKKKRGRNHLGDLGLEYNIKNVTYVMCEGVHWIQLAQERVQ